MSTPSYNSRGEALGFPSTYLHATIEVGTGATPKPDQVSLIRGENARLVLVESGALRMYLDLDTARMLAGCILAVVESEDDR